jgi:hypothetical protein
MIKDAKAGKLPEFARLIENPSILYKLPLPPLKKWE